MCEIATVLAAVSLVATAAGTITSMNAAQQQAHAQAKAARYQAQVAMNNASLAEQNAQAARQAGTAKEEAKRMQVGGLLSEARAASAANGVDVNSGSAVDLQADVARMGELDAMTIRSNAAKEASGYQAQGMNYQAQAQLDEMQGQSALEAGNIQEFGSLMSGISSASSSALSMNQYTGWLNSSSGSGPDIAKLQSQQNID